MGSLPRAWDIPLLLFLSLIWASAFSMIKVAVPVVGPYFLVLCRCAIGAGLMLVMIQFSRGVTWPENPRSWFWLIFTGVISTALPFLLISFAEQKITSSLTAMLMTVSPLFAILLGHFTTDDEKINRGKLLGVGVGFMGTLYLLRDGMTGMDGAGLLHPLMVMLASVCYVIGGLMAKKLPAVSSEVIAAVVLSSSAVVMLPILFWDGLPALGSIPLDIWGALFWLGLMPSGVAFYLRYLLIKRAGYGFVSYVGYLIPVFAIVIGLVWLKEAITLATLLAMLVIIIGLFLTRNSEDFPWNMSQKLIEWRQRLN